MYVYIGQKMYTLYDYLVYVYGPPWNSIYLFKSNVKISICLYKTNFLKGFRCVKFEAIQQIKWP